MDGDWTTPDVVPLVRLMLRSRRVFEGQSRLAGALHRLAGGIARRLRDNSLAGSRRHIHRHYDLGNEFFGLFLDRDLRMYSCGYFESAADSLEKAQARKVDRICRALKLSPGDRVLEIGSGWGGFAVWAATHYGCRVTTTTISDEQYRHVRDWRSRIGEAGSRIDVLRADYRELTGRFDKVVSIEMFEAVGLNHYDDYFTGRRSPAGAGRRRCSCRPSPSTISGSRSITARRTGSRSTSFRAASWRRSARFCDRSRRTTSLSMYHAENFGTHYARTLHAWRARFHHNLDRVRALGYDERFIRMWDLYLGSCEATFLERHTGLFQLMLLKNGARRLLFNEPWSDTATAPQRRPPPSRRPECQKSWSVLIWSIADATRYRITMT